MLMAKGENTVVERLARAIQVAHGDGGSEELFGSNIEAANAVLEVLKDPPQDMLQELNSWAVCSGYIDEGWSAAFELAIRNGSEVDS